MKIQIFLNPTMNKIKSIDNNICEREKRNQSFKIPCEIFDLERLSSVSFESILLVLATKIIFSSREYAYLTFFKSSIQRVKRETFIFCLQENRLPSFYKKGFLVCFLTLFCSIRLKRALLEILLLFLFSTFPPFQVL